MGGWIEEGAQIDIFCTSHPFPNLLIFNGPAKVGDAISAEKNVKRSHHNLGKRLSKITKYKTVLL